MLKKYPITLILIFFNIAVYVWMVINGVDWLFPSSLDLLSRGGNFDGLTLGNEWWRLFTCIFIHAGALHLLVNMYGLFSLGSFVEKSIGWKRFLFLYVLSGIAGTLCSLVFNDFTVGVGASGAVFGLAGAEVILFFYLNKWSVAREGLIHFIVFIFLNLAVGLSFEVIDIAAHAGGLAGGILIAAGFFFLHSRRFRQIPQLMILSAVFIPLLVFIFFMIPDYPATYFEAFKKMISNEEKADNLSATINFMDELKKYRLEIVEAQSLFEENINLLKQFDSIPLLKSDATTLAAYNRTKKKSVDYILMSIDKGSLIYFDSAGIVLSSLDTLQPVEYGLGEYDAVYKKKNKEDIKFINRFKPVTMYYDQNWEETTKYKAFYFRTCRVDSIGRVQGFAFDYYLSGILQMKGPYKNDLKNGIFFYYHPNGMYESVGIHLMDGYYGKWQYFYPDGKLMKEIKFEDDSVFEWNYWDKWGNQTLVNGNGMIEDVYENDKPKLKSFFSRGLPHGEWFAFYEEGSPRYREKYTHGKLVLGESFDERSIKYTYTVINEPPQRSVSREEYEEYLSSALKIPPQALKMKVNGVVVVEVTVSETGKIIKTKALNKLGYGCEEEAERLVKNGPSFKAGKVRGQIAEMKVMVSVKF